jgi:hypothetical protein
MGGWRYIIFKFCGTDTPIIFPLTISVEEMRKIVVANFSDEIVSTGEFTLGELRGIILPTEFSEDQALKDYVVISNYQTQLGLRSPLT